MRAGKSSGKTAILYLELGRAYFHTVGQMASQHTRQRRKRSGDKHAPVTTFQMPAHSIDSFDEQWKRASCNCFFPLSDHRFLYSGEIIFIGEHRAVPVTQKGSSGRRNP